MAFKVIPNPTFPAEVVIVGQGVEQTLEVVFRHKDADAYQKLLDDMTASENPKTLADVLVEILESWNADIDCDRAGIEQLGRSQPGSLISIMQAYGENMVVKRKGN